MNTPTNLPPEFDGTHKPQSPVHKFEFTGNAADMWPIILKNFLFNILTLSLYRFWGRTNVRRYLWANTRFMGDPLEYTGRGGEMFMGFAVVLVAVFLPLFGLVTWAQLLLVQGNAAIGGLMMFAVYLLFFWLIPFGLYRSLKYRLSRTRWRGIRGAQEGNGVSYAWSAFGYYLLLIVTFGLTLPYVENKLWKIESDNRRFGTGAFKYIGESGPLFKAYFLALFMGLIALVAYSIVYGTVIGSPLEGVKEAAAGGGFSFLAFINLFIYYLGFFLVVGLAFLHYGYWKLFHFWNYSFFEGKPFLFSGGAQDMAKLYVGNILLTFFTLGIAYPIAQMRIVRYLVTNLSVEGDLDLGQIGQSSEAEPSFGEGLAEGFDMGTI